MSDPVVVAMGDEKLRDDHGTEENPGEVAEAAVHHEPIPEKDDLKEENTDPSTPTKVSSPFGVVCH